MTLTWTLPNSRKKPNLTDDTTSKLSSTSSNKDKEKFPGKNYGFIFICLLLLALGDIYCVIRNKRHKIISNSVTKIIGNNSTTNLLRTNEWPLRTEIKKQEDKMQLFNKSKQEPQPLPQETNPDLSDRGSASAYTIDAMPPDSYWGNLHNG